MNNAYPLPTPPSGPQPTASTTHPLTSALPSALRHPGLHAHPLPATPRPNGAHRLATDPSRHLSAQCQATASPSSLPLHTQPLPVPPRRAPLHHTTPHRSAPQSLLSSKWPVSPPTRPSLPSFAGLRDTTWKIEQLLFKLAAPKCMKTNLHAGEGIIRVGRETPQTKIVRYLPGQ